MSKLTQSLKQNAPNFYHFVIIKYPNLENKTTQPTDTINNSFIDELEKEKEELSQDDFPF